MKKTILILLVLLMLTLAACSGQAPVSNTSVQQSAPVVEAAVQEATPVASTASQNAVTGAAELHTSYEKAASLELQLLIGTLKLTGTDQAVTKDQAAALVPLWTNLQTLHQSLGPGQAQGDSTSQPQTDTTALQSQVDEAVKQIQTLMTPAQLQAIAGMQITRESAMPLMQELGMTMGGPGQGTGNGNMPQPPDGTSPAGGPGGQPPSDGQQPPNGEQPGNSQMTTPQAGQNGPRSEMIPPQLIDTLVQVLQKIAAGETITTIPTISVNAPAAPSQ